MAYQRRDYRLRIHDAGTTTPTDLTVDFTLELDGETTPYVPGPELNILKGRTESRPWSIRVRDTANALTGNLGASGRPDLLMRLAELQVNEDEGGWASLAVGRVTNLDETDGPDSFEVRVADERVIERAADIFGADMREAAFGVRATTRIYPAGRLVAWRGYNASGATPAEVAEVDGNMVRVRFANRRPTAATVRWLEADVRPGAPQSVASATLGYFRHARLHLDGSDYYIANLSRSLDRLPMVDFKAAADGEMGYVHVWVYMATPPSVGDEYADAYIYAPDADPSPEVPYHFSGHPFAIAEQIHDAIGVRYDSTEMDALKADTRWGTVHFAATKVEKASDWLERKVYLPTFVYPFIGTTGGVVHRSLLLAQMSDATYAALPTLDASSLASFPTFSHSERDAITIVRATMTSFLPATVAGIVSADPYGLFGSPAPREVMLDGLARIEVPYVVKHDTVATLGEKPLAVDFEGWMSHAEKAARSNGFDLDFVFSAEEAESRIAAYAREVFNLFGDGPILGDFKAMEAAASVDAPGYFKLDLDSFPNPAAGGGAGGRGGIRVVIATRRGFGPVGYDFEYLDAGAANQPLTVPAITVVQNATTPKHAVDVTIAGMDAGAACILKFGHGDPPTSWDRTESHDPDDTTVALGNGTYTFAAFPSGTDISVKGYAVKAGRLSSEFSAADVVATEALDAPTTFAATVIGNSVQVTWTNTEDYPFLPTRAAAAYQANPLPIASAAFLFENNPAGLAAFGGKYVDAYGGESPIGSVNATPDAAVTLDEPERVRIRQGRSAVGVGAVPSPTELIGYGLEVAWHPSTHAHIRFQVSTASDFSAIEDEFLFAPGAWVGPLFLPFDNTLRYVRARFERDGFTASDWGSTVSAYTAPLGPVDTPIYNDYPGGWASLRIDDTGGVWLDIGSDDPEAERAYYEVSAAGFSTVTEADSFSALADWPESIDTGIVLSRGETAYATVRFWNSLTRLAPSITDSETAPVDLSGQPIVVTATFDSLTLMLVVSCDEDTRSIKIERTDGGGAASIEVDGNVSEVDMGALGMTTADLWVVDITARSDPSDDVDGGTLTSVVPKVLTGSTWGAGSHPQFEAGVAGVTMDAPAVADDTVTVTVDCTSTSASYELKFYEQHRFDGEGWSAAVDITAATSPDATGDDPPTVPTAYDWNTGVARVAKGTAVATVYYQKITCEILETSGAIARDSRDIERSWYAVAP